LSHSQVTMSEFPVDVADPAEEDKLKAWIHAVEEEVVDDAGDEAEEV
jgi:hypothetical protein